MPQTYDIAVLPEQVGETEVLEAALIAKGKPPGKPFHVLKESIDARTKRVVYRIRCAEGVGPARGYVPAARDVSTAKEVFVIGSGPCGLFAAIRLIERGLRPIVIERGKDVRNRRRDLAKLTREQVVDPDSNYCFGEGGAGTYSDGKLYTRSKKRGDVDEVLRYLVGFGAPEDITIKAHPHIGTNKLPQLITSIRKFIESCGGLFRFETKLTDLRVEGGRLESICLDEGEWIETDSVILATGHSARDIFYLLSRHRLGIEAKPFALGVRVEHPQEIIDRIQYHCEMRSEYLPPAAYSLSRQVEGRGVYSFCMCPGGIIAPCATAPGEIVTNGWSPSKRNNPFANSGIVVSITPEDYGDIGGPLAALEYQKAAEKAAWISGGGGQIAPAQRLVDFVEGRVSTDLPPCSYLPGLHSVELRDCLPESVHQRLAQAFKAFGKRMKGYLTNEAVVVATESRTSSPVRIPRNEDLEHPGAEGLFPAGEGAGYAGGIVSAAMDGIKVAEQIAIRTSA